GHLASIFSGEGPAAVASHAAVRIHDNLSPGQAGVAHGSADHEAAGRVDVVLHAHRIKDLGRHDRLDHLLDHFLFDPLGGHVRAVLGRHDDRVYAHRLPGAIFDGHLGFAVG